MLRFADTGYKAGYIVLLPRPVLADTDPDKPAAELVLALELQALLRPALALEPA
ncbi:hypothetical protein D3C84_1193910 [compost metagenome]